MKRLLCLKLFLTILLFAETANAQTTTVVTATVRDITGAIIPTGQITFELKPAVSTTISGYARFTPLLVSCGINQSSTVSLARNSNTVTATFTQPETFIVGSVITSAGWSDSTFNGTFTVATAPDNLHVTWAQTAANSTATGGWLSELRSNPGPGSCTLTQNTALTPGGTFYQVCLWPFFSKTACFNFYALTTPIDLSAVTPAPDQLPAGSGCVNCMTTSGGTSGPQDFLWDCWDTSSPENAIWPSNVSISAASVFTFSFTLPQSGHCDVAPVVQTTGTFTNQTQVTLIGVPNGSSGGGGGGSGIAGVASFGTPPRTGAVVPIAFDYSFPQISGTATEAQLPATTLFSDQNFTAGARSYDFSFATSFKLPPGILPASFPGGPRTVLSSYNAVTATFSGATQGQCTDAQSGGSYRIGTSGVGASDFGCLMIASSPGLQSWTLPDAGSPGFGNNWDGYITVPVTGGILTVTRDVASVFLNVNNQTSFPVLPGQRAYVTSPDNVNWNVYYDGNGTFSSANAAADIGATTILTPISNSFYWVIATVVCRSAVNGTETVTISYTDTNSIAQTITATTGTCNGGTPTVGSLSAGIRAKASTNIQYATTHATTQPNYDLSIALQQMGAQ